MFIRIEKLSLQGLQSLGGALRRHAIGVAATASLVLIGVLGWRRFGCICVVCLRPFRIAANRRILLVNERGTHVARDQRRRRPDWTRRDLASVVVDLALRLNPNLAMRFLH